MKARENAEQNAKVKIDKLNSLIDKWEKKEKKSKVLLEENVLEKRMKAELFNSKIQLAKDKVKKDQMVIDEKGYEEFEQYMVEANERQKKEEFKQREHSYRDYQRYKSNWSKIANQYSSADPYDQMVQQKSKEDYKALTKNLEDFEFKIELGRERSLILKQELVDKMKLFDKNYIKEKEDLQEQDKMKKLKRYYEKFVKHKSTMQSKQEDLEYQIQNMKQKYNQKSETVKLMLNEQLQRYETFRQSIIDKKTKKFEEIEQFKKDEKLLSLQRQEKVRLKFEDQKEAYQSLLEQQSESKHKLIQKHENLNKQYSEFKDSIKNFEEYRALHFEEKYRFLLNRFSLDPYYEMQHRFLNKKDEQKNRKKNQELVDLQNL